MKFLGVEVPEPLLAAVEARMKAGPFRYEDLIAVCQREAPGESLDFYRSIPDKMIQSYRRLGRIRETARGEWRWERSWV